MVIGGYVMIFYDKIVDSDALPRKSNLNKYNQNQSNLNKIDQNQLNSIKFNNIQLNSININHSFKLTPNSIKLRLANPNEICVCSSDFL